MLSECTLRNITINQALWETILKIVKELKSVNLTYYQKYKGQFQLFFCGFSDKLFSCPKKNLDQRGRGSKLKTLIKNEILYDFDCNRMNTFRYPIIIFLLICAASYS